MSDFGALESSSLALLRNVISPFIRSHASPAATRRGKHQPVGATELSPAIDRWVGCPPEPECRRHNRRTCVVPTGPGCLYHAFPRITHPNPRNSGAAWGPRHTLGLSSVVPQRRTRLCHLPIVCRETQLPKSDSAVARRFSAAFGATARPPASAAEVHAKILTAALKRIP